MIKLPSHPGAVAIPFSTTPSCARSCADATDYTPIWLMLERMIPAPVFHAHAGGQFSRPRENPRSTRRDARSRSGAFRSTPILFSDITVTVPGDGPRPELIGRRALFERCAPKTDVARLADTGYRPRRCATSPTPSTRSGAPTDAEAPKVPLIGGMIRGRLPATWSKGGGRTTPRSSRWLTRPDRCRILDVNARSVITRT